MKLQKVILASIYQRWWNNHNGGIIIECSISTPLKSNSTQRRKRKLREKGHTSILKYVNILNLCNGSHLIRKEHTQMKITTIKNEIGSKPTIQYCKIWILYLEVWLLICQNLEKNFDEDREMIIRVYKKMLLKMRI